MAVVPTVLNLENYNNWSSRIKTYLLAEDLWDIVQGTYEFPGEAERKAWEKKNVKALYAIQSSCGDDTYKLIKDKTSANVAWNTLHVHLNPDAYRIDHKDERSLVQAFPTRIDGNDRVAAMEGGLNAGRDEISNANDINATFVRIDGNDGDAAMEGGLNAGHDEISNANDINATFVRIDGNDGDAAMEEGLNAAHDEISKANDINATFVRIDGNDGDAAMEEGLDAAHDEISNANDINATFITYVKSEDWDNVIKLLREHPQLGRLPIKIFVGVSGTALHHAVMNQQRAVNVRILEQMVELMAKEDLEKQDDYGQTALFCLMRCHPERVELAKRMLEKNDKLLTIFSRYYPKTPLVVEAESMENAKGMARYLYSVTPHETLRVTDGAQLISLGFQFKRFDIAWNLIQRYPQLVITNDYNGDFPLKTLANNHHAFLSGRRLNFWEKLIYYGIRIRPLPPIIDNRVNVQRPESGQSDQRHLSNKNENQKPLSDQKENQRHFSCSGVGLFNGLVTNLQKLFGINHIYEMKLIHERVQQFLSIISKEKIFMSHLAQVLCVAAERGHAEFLTHFLGETLSFRANNHKGQNVFQIATECRHHKVYNLIYRLDESLKEDPNKQSKMQNILGWRDKFGNNMLHTVARITSLSQIYHIQGAALQIQRELQWFKELESIVDPKDCESVNADNRTPRQVFTDNHNNMGKEAEKSMKEIATSCTVVGALIVTIMFAAAITVPGGNDGDTGLPTFLTERVFTTFIVSDAISLFSSTTSVIMFLGILTSRYSEDDFHKSLPTKMIIGLFTLFLSIATMMIVFSCALYIMLKGKSSIVISSILLASVPITSFIWMQFPFLVELVISTFGPGLFVRNKKKLF